METALIAGIIGFIGGAVLMFFMKDKIVSIDASLHSKVDQLQQTTVNAARELAAHITAQTQTIADKIEPK